MAIESKSYTYIMPLCLRVFARRSRFLRKNIVFFIL